VSRLGRGERGANVVEFALVLPLLMLMLLGLIDYGYYFFVELAVTNAAREGARVATTYPGACPNGPGQSAAQSAVSRYMTMVGQAGNTQVNFQCSADALTGDPDFTVQVTTLFPQVTGYTLLPMPKTGSLVRATASATMRGVQ
jgi:Flp pilus assembly protein TadG